MFSVPCSEARHATILRPAVKLGDGIARLRFAGPKEKVKTACRRASVPAPGRQSSGRPPGEMNARRRLLILVVAYNAEKTIGDVLARIPAGALPSGTEVLIIDDASADDTFTKAR